MVLGERIVEESGLWRRVSYRMWPIKEGIRISNRRVVPWGKVYRKMIHPGARQCQYLWPSLPGARRIGRPEYPDQSR